MLPRVSKPPTPSQTTVRLPSNSYIRSCEAVPVRWAVKGERSRMAKQPSKPTRVQVHNPVTKQWVKLDTKTGRIVDSKKSPGPYQNVPKK